MPLVIEKIAATVVASVRGSLDPVSAERVEAGLLAQIDRGERRIALDLSNVDYVSQSGIRIVLLVDRLLSQQDGQLVVCGMTSEVNAAFDMGGFLPLLTVASTRAEALKMLA